MAQLREIKRRISSVKNTQQITRAMKMVAAAKLRRAQGRMLAMRPYAGKIEGIIDDLVLDLYGDEHPLFRARDEKNVATVVIAGDKGLCGGFNSHIIRKAKGHLSGLAGVEHLLWTIGKRASAALKKEQVKIVHSYSDVFDSLSYMLANDICSQLVERFSSGAIDSAYVVYNEFVTVVAQKPVVKKLLPIDFKAIYDARRARDAQAAEEGKPVERRDVYVIEPDAGAVLSRLVSRQLATLVYRAMLESYAAELGARMSAMDSATKNADDMIDRLTMDFNRARQTGITNELIDIVGGAESLKG